MHAEKQRPHHVSVLETFTHTTIHALKRDLTNAKDAHARMVVRDQMRTLLRFIRNGVLPTVHHFNEEGHDTACIHTMNRMLEELSGYAHPEGPIPFADDAETPSLDQIKTQLTKLLIQSESLAKMVAMLSLQSGKGGK